MKKIMILHRSDLFNLTSDLPIQEVQAEHFKIRIADFNSASFIAFEEDGLLKILKNDRGACITLTCTSFLMAAEMVTSGRAFDPFPVDKTGNPAPMQEYFRPDNDTVKLPPDFIDMSKGKLAIMLPSGAIAPMPIFKFNLPPKPESKFIVGYDPAAKDQPGPVAVLYDPLQPNNPKAAVAIFKGRDDDPDKFHQELMKTAQYYGHQLLEDYNDEINSSVATAIENPIIDKVEFPETLSEAIVYFDYCFDGIPLLSFQHTEIHFTSTFKVKHPEIYADIKKSCGFWCEDTPLYKNLSTIYKCDHEACLLNIILKGIYRYRNAGRDRSGDFKDIINSYKPE